MPHGNGLTIGYENFQTHGIVAHLRDGRVVAWSIREYPVTFSVTSPHFGEYDDWLQRLPDLKYIEHVIDVEFDYGMPIGTKTATIDGMTCKILVNEAVGKSLYGNVVGMTILGHAVNISGGTLTVKAVGTSLRVKVVAVGPP